MESHNAALYGPYQPCPIVQKDFTANDVTRLKTKLAELVTAVEAHPRITNDPARRAPRSLYFTWDFLRRTEHNLLQVDVPALVANDEVALEAYNDVLGRVSLSCTIITDETGEACRIITQNAPVDFGAEVREKAKALQRPAA